jgi:hypothetical protein
LKWQVVQKVHNGGSKYRRRGPVRKVSNVAFLEVSNSSYSTQREALWIGFPIPTEL